MELLLTAPVSASALVVGKWLAGWTLTLVPLALTLWFPLALVAVGAPDVAPLLTGYLGLALVAATFTAVGLLASALTRSPLLAAVLGFVLLLGSALCGLFAASAPPGLAGLLAWLSILLHFDALGAGVIATPHLAFFALATGTLLFLTAEIVDSRRWR
jgi:ABC-2 type transport system permease protein